MKNTKPFIKRLCAYVIDLTLVLTISSLIASTPIFKKEMKNYQKTYEEYREEYQNYMDYLTLLEESFKDEEITEEEYTKLQETNQYQEILSSQYDDKKITKEEYQDIISIINEEFELVLNDYSYRLNKQSLSNSIITLVCTFIYFGILQYFLKGQTIGKKILKLKVVSATEKELNIFTFMLRSLIINDILLNSIGIILLLLASKSTYLTANNIISISVSIVEAIIVYLVITREDSRGLHDLLFNTKVIFVSDETLTIKENTNKVIEAEVEEIKEEDNNEGKRQQKNTKRKK